MSSTSSAESAASASDLRDLADSERSDSSKSIPRLPHAVDACKVCGGSSPSQCALRAGWMCSHPSADACSPEPIAYIEHHKGGDNLVWDDPGGKCTPLYRAPPSSIAESEWVTCACNLFRLIIQHTAIGEPDWSEIEPRIAELMSNKPRQNLVMPSESTIRLACGEMSAQEMRTVKAALQWFIYANNLREPQGER